MQKTLVLLTFVASTLAPATQALAQDAAANTYIGVKTCAGICHKSEKQGNQLGIWSQSGHAQAYVTLTTAKANDIAKAKGLATPAAESPECLQCHALRAENVEIKDGVQCEMCHGAGSGYKSNSIMKDRAKSIAAGMKEYKDDAAIEAQCRSCHNEKSPTFKEFNFAERWAKIRHTVPKTPEG
ncbi:MAG: cytochrome C554 [Gemmatimonadetes bacterium]|nr:cytochrome C554 [Gemmatimonadota bacterium]